MPRNTRIRLVGKHEQREHEERLVELRELEQDLHRAWRQCRSRPEGSVERVTVLACVDFQASRRVEMRISMTLPAEANIYRT